MSDNKIAIRNLLLYGTPYYRDSTLIMMYVLQLSKEKLLCCLDDCINDDKAILYQQLIDKVVNGYPTKYILGTTEFMSLDFIVNDNVLIPRPETELLVELAIESIGEKEANVLDMCTGSGCIAVCIANYAKSNVSVMAVDISTKALDVAKENAKINKVFDQIDFLESDLFSNVPDSNIGSFELIVSNPPYIDTDVLLKSYKEGNLIHEPRLALDGGKDFGLEFYKKIINNCTDFLKDHGILLMEIGYDQANAVCKMIEEKGMKEITVIKDLSGKDRIIKATKKGNFLC